MKKKDVFKLRLMWQIYGKFAWFVIIYMVCSTFLYDLVNDFAFFNAGAGVLSCNILWQGLALSFVASLIDILFLTDKIIRNLSGIWRYILAFAVTLAVILLWVIAFQWIGSEKSNYIVFALIFGAVYAVVFFVGVWLSKRLESWMYNQLLAEYKSNLKGVDKN